MKNKNINEYAVYLTATSNQLLTERMNNGEIIDGMLCINFNLHEFTFTFGERLAFRFNECSLGSDKVFNFSDGSSFFEFSTEKPETIKGVK